MTNSSGNVWNELKEYKRKHMLNNILKGSIFLFGILCSAYIVINILEFSFRFGTTLRGLLLFTFFITGILTFYKYLFTNIRGLIRLEKTLSDEAAAEMIGKSFPEVADRLTNLILLKSSKTTQGANTLISAGIIQKESLLNNISFKSAIHYKSNKKFLKYVLSPVSVLALLLIINPAIFTDSTERIVHFNKEYLPKAPFLFHADVPEHAFRNEDLIVSLLLEGDALPQHTYLIHAGRKHKMVEGEIPGSFSYTFNKIQVDKDFLFEAAGYYSEKHHVQVVNRPNLKNFNVRLNYPLYTGKK
ncbi:MAG: ATPase, partial [Cyclobacteriaceae bacterium]|nr:ATPase [Cyclobacteriaceae bacterium]